jgi:hypothetical protein
MLSQKSNVQVVPKLTTEERFKMILARPRKKGRIVLAIPKYQPLKKEAV